MDNILNIEGEFIEAKPLFSKMGFFYYPECVQDKVYMIEYDDPNPKGKPRTETVMNKKLPVTHKILKWDLNDKQIK